MLLLCLLNKYFAIYFAAVTNAIVKSRAGKWKYTVFQAKDLIRWDIILASLFIIIFIYVLPVHLRCTSVLIDIYP